MKSISLLLVPALAAFVSAIPSLSDFQKIQELASSGAINTDDTAAQAEAIGGPKEVQQEPVVASKQWSSAKRVKIRYGPYKMPNTDKTNAESIVLGDNGMLDTGSLMAKKPCTDCLITWMQAGLENPDGLDANIDHGMWLHHMVMVNVGNGRKDTVCPIPLERFFSSGNERTISSFIAGGNKAGYHVKNGDNFAMMIELMNENKKEMPVYMTITYEYLPYQTAKSLGFKNVKALWLDVTGACGISFDFPRGKQFTLKMKPWTVNFDNGVVAGTGGHLHDGGVDVKAYINNNLYCDSTATYGSDPRYIQKSTKGMGGQAKTGMQHISHMKDCHHPVAIKKGDKIYITAKYDLVEHPAMTTNKGGTDEVMGISVMFVTYPLV